MTPERWRKVEDVLEAAMERAPHERATFLDEVCAGDQSLREEVESLLAHDERAGSFIEVPAFEVAPKSPTDHPADSSVGESIGFYKIIREIGKGGMGTVYLAQDTRLGRQVALKLLPERFTRDRDRVRRFQREARAVSALNHPNILTIYDIGQTEHVYFIATEFVDGETLRKRMANQEMALGEALDVIIQVASALKAAHTAGIVHRDIKPENVMIRRDGYVKVLDFGLAKLVESRAGDSQAPTMFQTRPGVLMGTPHYMSPEQVVGGSVDARSDLFSLGVVLYECIASRPAFSGPNVAAIWGEIQHVNPPPPSQSNPHVTPELNRITLKLLAKIPEARYQSADELLTDLRAVRAGLQVADQVSTHRLPPKVTTSRIKALKTLSTKLRHSQWFVPIILLLLLASGLLTYWGISWWRLSPSTGAQVWYDEGIRALHNGAYYQASMALERAVNENNKFALAHARLAEAYMELNNREKATTELLQVHNLISDRSALSNPDRLYVEAITAIAASDFASGIAKYHEIAQVAPNQPQVYVDLGRAYEKSNDIKDAISNYEEAAKHDPQYATPFLRLGILYGRQQQQVNSDDAFKKAEEIYQAQGNVEGRAEVHYQHGLLLLNGKRIPEAHAELQFARDLAHADQNQAQEILAMLQLSGVYIAEGNTEQAQQIANDAVERAKRQGMKSIAVGGSIDLGNAFFSHGDITNARKYFEGALDDALKVKDLRLEARAHLSLGSLDINRGDIDGGLTNVEKALDFYQKGGYTNEAAIALLLIGQAKRKQGEYNGALQALKERLQLAQQANTPGKVAEAQSEIGKVLLFQEKYPEALDHLMESYSIYQKLGDQKSIGYSLENRGTTLWPLGRYNESASILDQAFEIAQHGEYKALSVAVYLSRAQMMMSKHLFQEAKTNMQQALGLADPQDTFTQIETNRLLGLVATHSGDKREGLRLCMEAYDKAKNENNQWLFSQAQLALAEAMLESGDAQKTLELALQARESFARAEQHESEWRAWLVAALASQSMGDLTKGHEYASNADAVFSDLKQTWYSADFSTYRARPDVQYLRKQLSRALAKAK